MNYYQSPCLKERGDCYICLKPTGQMVCEAHKKHTSHEERCVKRCVNFVTD